MKTAIKRLVRGENLDSDVMRAAICTMMTGQADAAVIGAFLAALAAKGETVKEIIEAAQVMRELSQQVDLPEGIWVDPVGTGGDGASLFNVSTASAIVAAAAGIKIAKHGNTSASSSSGSADVLQAAGIHLKLTPAQVKNSVMQCGFGFMYAPVFHPAMKHVAPVRRAIGIRSIFNLLGPLCNPARVKHQVIGVFHARWLRPIVEVAKALGGRRIIAIHSEDGLDELSVVAKTSICELHDDGSIDEYTVQPTDFAMQYANYDLLKVENARESLTLIRKLFTQAEPSIGIDIIALNAAAIFLVAGRSNSWMEAFSTAKNVIISGRANTKLDEIIRFNQQIGTH